MKNLVAVLALVAISTSDTPGQFSPTLPSWVGQPDPASLELAPHPGLVGVDSMWQNVLFNSTEVVSQGLAAEYYVHYHCLHGDVALYEAGSFASNVGRFDTGVDYIYDLSIVYDLSGPSGVLIVGQVGGKSRVLYSPWTEAQCPSTWSFVQVIPDSLPQTKYIRGDIIGNYLFLLDAAGENVVRFNDNDMDSFSDALGAPALLDVSGSSSPIWGFYSMGSGRVGASFYPDGFRIHRIAQSEIVDTSAPGVLELSTVHPNGATRAAAVHDRLVGGQTRVRVYGGYLSTVKVLSGPNANQLAQVSGKYRILSSDGTAEVSVSPALRAGDIARVASSAIADSVDYNVSAPTSFMLPLSFQDAAPVPHGGGILLRGVNLRQNIQVSINVAGVSIPNVKKTLVGTDQLFLSSLFIPDLASNAETMRIVVSHSDFRHPFEYWIEIIR